MPDYYKTKYQRYKMLYLSQKTGSKLSNATINAANSSARRRHRQQQMEALGSVSNKLECFLCKTPVSESYSRPKQFRISDEITIIEFIDNPEDFGPDGQPDYYRARGQRSKDIWFGMLELENIKENITGNCQEIENIRLRGPVNKETEWPTCGLSYTYPYGICGKHNFQDREGNCWMLATDKSGLTLLKTDPITTLGPHNKDPDQFRDLPKSKNKDVYTRRPQGVPIGSIHPER